MMEKLSNLLKSIKKNIIEYILTNRLFITFFILSLLGTMFVRKFTIGTFWAIKPIITDIGLILIIGAFGYLFKPKNQFVYYFIWLIIFTVMNIVNSIYYIFFTTFASFGELSTLSQAETVTGSIFDKLRFIDIMYVINPIIFYFVHKVLSSSTYYYFLDKVDF